MMFRILILNTTGKPDLKKNIHRFFENNQATCEIDELFETYKLGKYLESKTPDLIFVESRDSSVEIGKEIRKVTEEVATILITDRYVETMDLEMKNFDSVLYRPLQEDVIDNLLETSLENMKKKLKLFLFKYNNRMTIIPYKEIHCFEKLLTTIKIHTDRGDYVVKEQFKKLLKTLEGDVFFRCHNNYIVNIENIDHIDDKYCHFTRIKKKVPIAGKYRLKLIEKLPR